MVLGVGNDFDNAIARTAPAGQSIIHQYLTPTGDTYWMQRQNAATPLSGATVTINDTAPTGDRYNLAIVEILSPAVVVPTYTLSGSITPTPAGANVTVTLTGAATANTVTDASGNFKFINLQNGTYTVTPSKSGFTFNPPNSTKTISGSDVPGVNFTPQAIPTYQISGTISPSTLGSGVKVTLSGAAGATTNADTTGFYKFPGLLNGNYTVTPSQSGLSLTPPNQPVTVSNADMPNINFSAQTVTTVPLAMDVTTSADKGTPSLTVATPSFSTTSGNELLLAFVATDYTSGPNTTVTAVNGAGLTWVPVGRSNTQSGSSEIWPSFCLVAARRRLRHRHSLAKRGLFNLGGHLYRRGHLRHQRLRSHRRVRSPRVRLPERPPRVSSPPATTPGSSASATTSTTPSPERPRPASP